MESRLTDSWYKITTEALQTVASIAHKLRPRKPNSVEFIHSEFSEATYGSRLAAGVFPCLGETHIDQEIKETSIYAGTRYYSYDGLNVFHLTNIFYIVLLCVLSG